MLNVCFQCGTYHADKSIDPSGPFAVCPDCGYRQPFRQLPLLVVSGASGTGKTAVCRELTGRFTRAVLLDSDIIWRPEFNTPDTKYRDFFETWLRLCKNISQSGRPVVLFGAGAGVPENIEPCVERRYFSRVHYLALVCSGGILTERLKGRPAWRGSRKSAFLEEQLRFNRWFQEYAGTPAIDLLDTSDDAPGETARRAEAWMNGILGAQGLEIDPPPMPQRNG